jgi:hypothetical protein
MDKVEDAKCIRILKKVDKARKDLKTLEAQLNEARIAYGKRRGMGYFSEWNLRNTIAFEQGIEDAADRDAWEKAHA